MSQAAAVMALSARTRHSSIRPRAAAWESLGSNTRPMAEIKAVGRLKRGKVIPHMTPKADMAEETSLPVRTSRWGTNTAVQAPIRLLSRAVAPIGRAMDSTRRRRAFRAVRPSEEGEGMELGRLMALR